MCSTSKREMALLEIFTSMGLFALITDEPTHYRGHTLDNILINNESPNLSHCILDQHTALSDHFPIKITLHVNQIVSTNPNKVIYSFNNAADIQSLGNSWETFPFHLDSASEIVDAFYSHIQLSIPLCFPKKRSKRIQQPFYQGIQYLRFLVLVLSTFGIGIGIGIESIPGLVNGIDPIVNWY